LEAAQDSRAGRHLHRTGQGDPRGTHQDQGRPGGIGRDGPKDGGQEHGDKEAQGDHEGGDAGDAARTDACVCDWLKWTRSAACKQGGIGEGTTTRVQPALS